MVLFPQVDLHPHQPLESPSVKQPKLGKVSLSCTPSKSRANLFQLTNLMIPMRRLSLLTTLPTGNSIVSDEMLLLKVLQVEVEVEVVSPSTTPPTRRAVALGVCMGTAGNSEAPPSEVVIQTEAAPLCIEARRSEVELSEVEALRAEAAMEIIPTLLAEVEQVQPWDLTKTEDSMYSRSSCIPSLTASQCSSNPAHRCQTWRQPACSSTSWPYETQRWFAYRNTTPYSRHYTNRRPNSASGKIHETCRPSRVSYYDG